MQMQVRLSCCEPQTKFGIDMAQINKTKMMFTRDVKPKSIILRIALLCIAAHQSETKISIKFKPSLLS